MQNILKRGIHTSEFWVLVGTALVLIIDASIKALTDSSIFAEHPDLANKLIGIAGFWASIRTVFKLVLAAITGKVDTTQSVG